MFGKERTEHRSLQTPDERATSDESRRILFQGLLDGREVDDIMADAFPGQPQDSDEAISEQGQ